MHVRKFHQQYTLSTKAQLQQKLNKAQLHDRHLRGDISEFVRESEKDLAQRTNGMR